MLRGLNLVRPRVRARGLGSARASSVKPTADVRTWGGPRAAGRGVRLRSWMTAELASTRRDARAASRSEGSERVRVSMHRGCICVFP